MGLNSFIDFPDFVNNLESDREELENFQRLWGKSKILLILAGSFFAHQRRFSMRPCPASIVTIQPLRSKTFSSSGMAMKYQIIKIYRFYKSDRNNY